MLIQTAFKNSNHQHIIKPIKMHLFIFGKHLTEPWIEMKNYFIIEFLYYH